jgi:hypothetical protein
LSGLRHGERTKAAIAEQRKFSALLKMLRAGLASRHQGACAGIIEGQAAQRLDSERTAPVKANQRLTVANPRPRRHWAATVILASGKPSSTSAVAILHRNAFTASPIASPRKFEMTIPGVAGAVTSAPLPAMDSRMDFP